MNVSNTLADRDAPARQNNFSHDAEPQDEVLFDVINHVGLITLNRPKALNALTHTMVLAMAEHLEAWAADSNVYAVLVRGAGGKAFCAGGDIRALYQSFHAQGRLHHDFFVDEYRLDYRIHRFPKPCVAVMDGIVMGGGMGIAQGAALRIVTERTRLAMPETGIGLVPDVGASHFLSKMQAELALYLGVTGQSLSAADALCCGLADAYLPSAALGNLDRVLAQVAWSGDPLADIRTALLGHDRTLPSDPPLLGMLPAVYRHFRAPTIGTVMASLASETDPPYRAWAERTLQTMQTRSPLMMCVTRHQLLAGRRMDLADCFRMELGLVRRCLEGGDFIEGVRALIIDKDNAPRWSPMRVDEVNDALVRDFFEPPWRREDHPLAELGPI